MTDVDTAATVAADRASLSRLKLPELQALAAERGIVGAAKLRKGDLVDSLSETPEADATTESVIVDEAPVAEVATGDTIPARRSRRATASTEEVAALAVELPAVEATPEPIRSREEIAAELDSLLPEVTSGADPEGDEPAGRGR
ncbi:MAG TPA: Rho termination factor N-terminal domain-containing protein, partial [Pseudolysinimonas sp.]|nr:Rho termination factor N-terminal domain-containing protein [Pseudolysinimonas sp.]